MLASGSKVRFSRVRGRPPPPTRPSAPRPAPRYVAPAADRAAVQVHEAARRVDADAAAPEQQGLLGEARQPLGRHLHIHRAGPQMLAVPGAMHRIVGLRRAVARKDGQVAAEAGAARHLPQHLDRRRVEGQHVAGAGIRQDRGEVGHGGGVRRAPVMPGADEAGAGGRMADRQPPQHGPSWRRGRREREHGWGRKQQGPASHAHPGTGLRGSGEPVRRPVTRRRVLHRQS